MDSGIKYYNIIWPQRNGSIAIYVDDREYPPCRLRDIDTHALGYLGSVVSIIGIPITGHSAWLGYYVYAKSQLATSTRKMSYYFSKKEARRHYLCTIGIPNFSAILGEFRLYDQSSMVSDGGHLTKAANCRV